MLRKICSVLWLLLMLHQDCDASNVLPVTYDENVRPIAMELSTVVSYNLILLRRISRDFQDITFYLNYLQPQLKLENRARDQLLFATLDLKVLLMVLPQDFEMPIGTHLRPVRLSAKVLPELAYHLGFYQIVWDAEAKPIVEWRTATFSDLYDDQVTADDGIAVSAEDFGGCVLGCVNFHGKDEANPHLMAGMVIDIDLDGEQSLELHGTAHLYPLLYLVTENSQPDSTLSDEQLKLVHLTRSCPRPDRPVLKEMSVVVPVAWDYEDRTVTFVGTRLALTILPFVHHLGILEYKFLTIFFNAIDCEQFVQSFNVSELVLFPMSAESGLAMLVIPKYVAGNDPIVPSALVSEQERSYDNDIRGRTVWTVTGFSRDETGAVSISHSNIVYPDNQDDEDVDMINSYYDPEVDANRLRSSDRNFKTTMMLNCDTMHMTESHVGSPVFAHVIVGDEVKLHVVGIVSRIVSSRRFQIDLLHDWKATRVNRFLDVYTSDVSSSLTETIETMIGSSRNPEKSFLFEFEQMTETSRQLSDLSACASYTDWHGHASFLARELEQMSKNVPKKINGTYKFELTVRKLYEMLPHIETLTLFFYPD